MSETVLRNGSGDHRTVALIIPTLNEANHIGPLLSAMSAQSTERVAVIVVADGGSTDGTQAIVSAAAARDSRIRLLINPARLQAAGINRAVATLPPDIEFFIRIDAHARYPDDFVAALLDEQTRSSAQSVVNQLHSVGESCFQRAVAAASNSRFGTGGAIHRIGGVSRFVDHGHHALFDCATFARLGGYDETFYANEDAEYDTRLRKDGGRVWFTDRAPVGYYPRGNIGALALQYFRYGRGRAMTRAKHGEALRARQLAPTILLSVVLFSLLLSVRFPEALLVVAVYLASVLAAVGLLLFQTRDACVAGAVVALPIMHLSWGGGFIVETITQAGRPPRY